MLKIINSFVFFLLQIVHRSQLKANQPDRHTFSLTCLASNDLRYVWWFFVNSTIAMMRVAVVLNFQSKSMGQKPALWLPGNGSVALDETHTHTANNMSNGSYAYWWR